MFFKKTKDCIELLNANKQIVGKPLQNRFIASAIYSYPSHKDQEAMNRIFHQKKLIDENSVFETVYFLARNRAYRDEHIKFTNTFTQEIPHWSDKRNYSQSSTKFLLNSKTYSAEQHSSNFNCAVFLYKNSELIFGATLIGHRADERDAIAIENSKLDENEITLLVALANLSNETAKTKKDAICKELMEEQTSDLEENIKRNFE